MSCRFLFRVSLVFILGSFAWGISLAEEGASPADLAEIQEAAEPISTPPTLRPIAITFSGSLSSIDVESEPSTMVMEDRYGVQKRIHLPASTPILEEGAAKGTGDLVVGDKMTVRYTYDVSTGKRTAVSIQIGEGGLTSS